MTVVTDDDIKLGVVGFAEVTRMRAAIEMYSGFLASSWPMPPVDQPVMFEDANRLSCWTIRGNATRKEPEIAWSTRAGSAYMQVYSSMGQSPSVTVTETVYQALPLLVGAAYDRCPKFKERIEVLKELGRQAQVK